MVHLIFLTKISKILDQRDNFYRSQILEEFLQSETVIPKTYRMVCAAFPTFNAPHCMLPFTFVKVRRETAWWPPKLWRRLDLSKKLSLTLHYSVIIILFVKNFSARRFRLNDLFGAVKKKCR